MEVVDAVPVKKFMTDAEQLADLCEKLDRWKSLLCESSS
jgi:hypothetical protein